MKSKTLISCVVDAQLIGLYFQTYKNIGFSCCGSNYFTGSVKNHAAAEINND